MTSAASIVRPRPAASRSLLLAGWLVVVMPAARSAASPPAPVFGPPSTNPFGITDIGKDASPAFADLDGDGDVDALLGSLYGDLWFFRDTGSATAPVFAPLVMNPFGLTNPGPQQRTNPALVDFDGDGDLDAVVGNFHDSFAIFRNTGLATSPAFGAASMNQFGLYKLNFDSAPTFGDLDGDGDLDLLVGEYYGDMGFFRNTGTVAVPAFKYTSTNPFGLSNVGSQNHAAPTFVDLDGDGDLDVVVGLWSGGTSFFRNTGTTSTPAFAAPRSNAFGIGYAGKRFIPFFIDVDGDGDLDGFAGNYDGVTLSFEGLTSELLFEDGFQSGSVGNWSSHTP